MISYIRKEEYFSWIDAYQHMRKDYPSASINNLKDVQDHFVMSRLDGLKGMRILEIGGADCRILRNFSSDNECWNAEKFEGKAGGPSRVISTPGVKNTPVFLGEFSELLPDAYFDIVLSVSVVEHVETPHLQAFFNDIARVLKPGGKTFHAIDVYLFDEDRLDDKWAAHTKNRLERYIEVETFTEGKLQAATRPDITTDPAISLFVCLQCRQRNVQME